MPSIDYAKWDNVVDSDDEDDAPVDATPAAAFGKKLMEAWLTEAAPGVSADEISLIVKFVEKQQPRIGERDNRSQSTQIVQFLESQRCAIRTAPLVAAVAASQARDLEALPSSERAPAARVRAALTTALNTLCAAKECGGPRQLFESMRASPIGDVATRYAQHAYAAAAVDAYANARLRAAASAQPPRKALPKLRVPSGAGLALDAPPASGQPLRMPSSILPSLMPGQADAAPTDVAAGGAEKAPAPPPARKLGQKWTICALGVLGMLLVLVVLLLVGTARLALMRYSELSLPRPPSVAAGTSNVGMEQEGSLPPDEL